MMKGKVKRLAVMRAAKPAGELYAQLLSRVLIRSKSSLGDKTFNEWHGAVRARNWLKVISLADSLGTVEHASVLDWYVKEQLVALVKKYPFTSDEAPGFDPELAAWKKFQVAEHRCKRINQRLAALKMGDGFRYPELIQEARRWIRSTIGQLPNLDRIHDLCDFGPGASVGVTGNRTNIARKLLASRWSCTRLALSKCTMALWKHAQIRDYVLRDPDRQFVCYDFEEFSSRVASRVDLVTHNNISFVPKTFKTKRSIASEPLLNGYYQKGIDEYLRERLARVGIDLKDQFANCELARRGSLGGDNPYCTIDLASASDSLSDNVAKLLLPPAWYRLLNDTRSHCYRYRGKTHVYHKFVSMGNGFCFPLQTLIFAAICHACSKSLHGEEPRDFRVYGDDIIVRRSIAALVLEVLRYLGFRHNPEKTFIFGRFRESCGTDWYCGQDVRPVYLDFRLTSTVDLYKFHNSTLRSEFSYPLFEDVRSALREACPVRVRFLRHMHGNADAAFTVSMDVASSCPYFVWNRSTYAFSWLEVQTSGKRDKLNGFEPDVCNSMEYLAVLRGSHSRSPLTVRRETKALVRRKSYWAIPGEMSWAGADEYRGWKPPVL